MIHTSCKMETLHLLRRGFTSRGFRIWWKSYDELEVLHNDGHFSVGLFPGNRRILISFHSFIEPQSRNKGLGKRMLRIRELVAREAGINLMLATVRDDNTIERHLLRKCGWKILMPRPETAVSMWFKMLRR